MRAYVRPISCCSSVRRRGAVGACRRASDRSAATSAGSDPHRARAACTRRDARIPAARAVGCCRGVDRHHHVRVDRDGDVDRVARSAARPRHRRRCSAAAARAASPAIGVLDALRTSAAYRSTRVGGTSIGSLIAGGAARGLTPEELAAQLARRGCRHVTVRRDLPRAVPRRPAGASPSASGKVPTASISRTLAQHVLRLDESDDRPRPRSTDTARPGTPSGRASRFRACSLPCAAPTGDLLVDGGLLDNLPVGVMRERPPQHHGDRRRRRTYARHGGGFAAARRVRVGVASPPGPFRPTARAYATPRDSGACSCGSPSSGSERRPGPSATSTSARTSTRTASPTSRRSTACVVLGREAGRRAVDEWQGAQARDPGVTTPAS